MSAPMAETIRDTYGDYIADDSGKATYSSPECWRLSRTKAVERDLKLMGGIF